MIDPAQSRLERLSPLLLAVATVSTTLLLLISLVFIIGVIVAIAEAHETRPTAFAVAGIGVLVAAGLGILLRRLFMTWRQRKGAYSRRYTTMWLAVFGLGMIAGVTMGLINGLTDGVPELVSNDPLPPLVAGISALIFLVTLGLATILYFRAIDDHEQSAYLWSSTIAFHFLLFALPALWLLARGGIIAPLDLMTVVGLIFLSIIVQLVSWAWYKYR